METAQTKVTNDRPIHIVYKEFIVGFEEFFDDPPLMRDHFSDSEIENKEIIIDFLLNSGYVDLATSATAVDVFTGEDTGIRSNLRSDGTYSWGQKLAYYVDRYNLELPDDFVRHIIESKG